MSTPSIEGRENTALPDEFHIAHELCFTLHDILCQMLTSGLKDGAFKHAIKIRDEEDRLAFPKTSDILSWLDATGRSSDRDSIVVNTIFPAALSDMLHCIYEALENSRKGKLAIAFMLLRKPLQETLHLFETMIVTRTEFVNQLSTDPTKLNSQKSGGIEPHTKRIKQVISALPKFFDYDPAYLAQLRYAKNHEESFDGICNKAIHLFTTHPMIRTEPFNLNFIFSDQQATLTQWAFIYSRLPYILSYTHDMIEFLCSSISRTQDDYLDYIYRRKSALILIWSGSVRAPYSEPRLSRLADDARAWIVKQSGQLSLDELTEMAFAEYRPAL